MTTRAYDPAAMPFPILEAHRAPYVISTDPARFDLDAIHAYLTRSYWSPGIPRDTVARAVQNSLCAGLYLDHQQIGFARVVTDAATYAYLCDVYILEDHRARGLGKWLMQFILAHPSLQNLRRFTLATRDAHDLYAAFGFTPLAKPDRFMEIHRPDVYAPPATPLQNAEPA